MKTLKFELGILLCGRLRDFLEECKFDGMNIAWLEGSGWLSREWIVKGDDKDMEIVRRSLNHWRETNNL